MKKFKKRLPAGAGKSRFEKRDINELCPWFVHQKTGELMHLQTMPKGKGLRRTQIAYDPSIGFKEVTVNVGQMANDVLVIKSSKFRFPFNVSKYVFDQRSESIFLVSPNVDQKREEQFVAVINLGPAKNLEGMVLPTIETAVTNNLSELYRVSYPKHENPSQVGTVIVFYSEVGGTYRSNNRIPEVAVSAIPNSDLFHRRPYGKMSQYELAYTVGVEIHENAHGLFAFTENPEFPNIVGDVSMFPKNADSSGFQTTQFSNGAILYFNPIYTFLQEPQGRVTAGVNTRLISRAQDYIRSYSAAIGQKMPPLTPTKHILQGMPESMWALEVAGVDACLRRAFPNQMENVTVEKTEEWYRSFISAA